MIYLFYQVNANEIYLIKFILEAYENLFAVSTIDRKTQKIQVCFTKDQWHDALQILKELGARFYMKRQREPWHLSQGQY